MPLPVSDQVSLCLQKGRGWEGTASAESLPRAGILHTWHPTSYMASCHLHHHPAGRGWCPHFMDKQREAQRSEGAHPGHPKPEVAASTLFSRLLKAIRGYCCSPRSSLPQRESCQSGGARLLLPPTPPTSVTRHLEEAEPAGAPPWEAVQRALGAAPRGRGRDVHVFRCARVCLGAPSLLLLLSLCSGSGVISASWLSTPDWGLTQRSFQHQKSQGTLETSQVSLRPSLGHKI